MVPTQASAFDRCDIDPGRGAQRSWDRFIVATARAMALPLVMRDERIGSATLVEKVW